MVFVAVSCVAVQTTGSRVVAVDQLVNHIMITNCCYSCHYMSLFASACTGSGEMLLLEIMHVIQSLFASVTTNQYTESSLT